MAMMKIPESLQAKAALFTKHIEALHHPLAPDARRLLYASDYAGRQIKHLQRLLNEDDCQQQLQREDYPLLVEHISLDLSLKDFRDALRDYRHRHLLRLMLRELAGFSDIEETMAGWSDCADAIILHTLRYCEKQLEERYGHPHHVSGERAQLIVLAMGKLGGRELNFSSDIDLIFAFTAAGQTDGLDVISNEQYFSKIVQQCIQLLQTVTANGFVFRVDLRLRPYGDSGPLVTTLASLETYYQEQGRDWERYAMVKARPICVCSDRSNAWFDRLITAFVYRRYVDFSVIESLRSIKAMIVREVLLNPMLDNIKHGRGGIREVEFIIQCFQLIRGGRLPHIQQQNAMAALEALKKEGLVAHTKALQQAYLFLRKLENAVQMLNDQQTHSLPLDTVKQAQLMVSLGYERWDELLAQLTHHQAIISEEFHAVLGKEEGLHDDKRLLNNQLASLWQGHIEEKMAINLLASLGFQESARCFQLIYTFRHSPRCRRLSQAARMRLDCFMVLLLGELSQVERADDVLLQVLRLLENIVGRSAYLALLIENLPALQELLYWFAHSPFITNLLVSQPFLFEVLVDRTQTWRPLSKRELKQLLQRRLVSCDDTELQDDGLRQFKLTCWLLAARAELYGQCDALRIGRFLADVAEVIVGEVFAIACQQLSTHYPAIMRVKSRFAIVAYGKLGSQEMNYDSDLDLVFLHTVMPEDEGLLIRLTQKILHLLTTRTQAGMLYTVDTRLRPSGSAGLLVSHLDAFIDYQRTQAWIWEHQALVRARVLFSTQRLRRVFNQLKKDILFLPRDRLALSNEVCAMRAKIGKQEGSNTIKHVRGGLLDLDFLVQFLVLACPSQGLIRCTNTRAQLQQLSQQSILNHTQLTQLRRAYRHYHRILHQQLLQQSSVESEKQQADVQALCQLFYRIIR